MIIWYNIDINNRGDDTHGVIKDITGQKFGRLIALERKGYKYNKDGSRAVTWLCKCDCGNLIEVCGIDLRNGHTKSCGCLQKEILIQRNKETIGKNIYNLSGEYGIGYTSKGEEFYFDLEDYDKIKSHYWMINNNGYVVTSKNKLFMHRIIMNTKHDLWKRVQVDHIHGNNTRNDNRKNNLRIVTPTENGMNRKRHSNNTSGITGVYWNKKQNKWNAYITVGKNTIYLGSFVNKDSAIRSRKEAEEKYFGEFSYDNSQAM